MTHRTSLKDIQQQQPLSLNEMDFGPSFKNQLINHLHSIQQDGRYWDDLPPPTTTQKMKHEWRSLHPSGFSN